MELGVSLNPPYSLPSNTKSLFVLNETRLLLCCGKVENRSPPLHYHWIPNFLAVGEETWAYVAELPSLQPPEERQRSQGR